MRSQYGTCSKCRARRSVRGDGLVRLHKNPFGLTCKGSGQLPDALDPPTPWQASRWLVERSQGSYEDIGAANFEVLASGALEFYNGDDVYRTDRIVIAAGQWITVCEAAE